MPLTAYRGQGIMGYRQMSRLVMGACALIGCAPAAAQDVQFSIAGTNLQVPLPAGFCAPEASTRALAQKTFGANPSTIFLALIVRCDAKANDPLQDYIVITASALGAALSISRSELFANSASDFDPPQFRDFIANEVSRPNSGQNQTLTTAPILSDPPIALGHDEVCLYLGGEKPGAHGKPYTTRVGACMTSVSNKVIRIYRYADPRSGSTIGRLLRETRTIALSIKAGRGG
jgi:hypothetical protein